MPSRLLQRLDAQIAAARDPVALACLRAERAGFLGRQGQMELARAELQAIQREFARDPHVAVSAWLALAEGQIDHYSELGAAAHDRFNRARALAAAAQLKPLQALAAAWLAHTEDIRMRFDRMAPLCAESLRLAPPDYHTARWRVCLTVATCYHFGGREDVAARWYAAARHHAMADGDEVAVSALMYNLAAFRSDRIRTVSLYEPEAQERAASVMIGAESAQQFDAVIGLQSLDWLVPVLQAHLHVVDGRYEQALAMFDEHVPRSASQWRERMQPAVAADRAWCLLNLGQVDAAREEAANAVAGFDAPCDIDDRARAHGRLAQVFTALGDAEAAARHAEAGRRDYEGQCQIQARLLGWLDEALDGLSPG
jgi:tetratricopeptide (TPR) repeat protein